MQMKEFKCKICNNCSNITSLGNKRNPCEEDTCLRVSTYRSGMKEVTDWLEKSCGCFKKDEQGKYLMQSYPEQLERWGIE